MSNQLDSRHAQSTAPAVADTGAAMAASGSGVSRRDFLRASALAAAAATLAGRPLLSAGTVEPLGRLDRRTRRQLTAAATTSYNLTIDRRQVNVGGRTGAAVLVNDSLPGPLLRFREGDDVIINVTNRLSEDSSIHWHGFLVPFGMDGVPGFSFAGIRPSQTFTYRFRIHQSGTYWYHSHSGGQEQQGVYGPIIIEPAGKPAYAYDRDYVVMLSDWSPETAEDILSHLKKNSSWYNYQRRTVPQFFRALFRAKSEDARDAVVQDRLMWARMRMDATDISDVTGATYTYLMNGQAPGENWTALFKAGERVRLRFINGSSMTFFDVKIPNLPMTVVQSDGQDVKPVTVDEIRIGVAETYDVIVTPQGGAAYTIFAQALDRSGYARGTISERAGVMAPIPPMDPRPLRKMDMMNMDMAGMDMSGMNMSGDNSLHDVNSAASATTMKGMDMPGMSMPGMSMPGTSMPGMNMPGMNMSGAVTDSAKKDTTRQSMQNGAMQNGAMQNGAMQNGAMQHGGMQHPPPEQRIMPLADSTHADSARAVDRLHDAPRTAGMMPDAGGMDRMPGMAHGDVKVADTPEHAVEAANAAAGNSAPGLRKLNYADLEALTPNLDVRPPQHELVLHLTGDMMRYFWTINGKKLSESEPIRIRQWDRVQIKMVNETMMDHPMHLHGVFMEVQNGRPVATAPRKHTVIVPPFETATVHITAIEPGAWAFHCHLLYHMMTGMFVKVLIEAAPKPIALLGTTAMGQ